MCSEQQPLRIVILYLAARHSPKHKLLALGCMSGATKHIATYTNGQL
jgi:hypothetical protein